MKIYSRWDGSKVIFENNGKTLRETVLAAVSTGAVLRDADLSHADLSDADLSDADLRDAVLRGAVLRDADLRGAVLRGAVLRGAVLSDAVLRDADLTPIRDDFWAVLSAAPVEVPALIEALKAGKVNGSTYTGECACLVGTIANAKKCDYQAMPNLIPNSHRPAEAFFTAIKPGDVPSKNAAAKLALEWAEDWLKRMQSAFAVAK